MLVTGYDSFAAAFNSQICALQRLVKATFHQLSLPFAGRATPTSIVLRRSSEPLVGRFTVRYDVRCSVLTPTFMLQGRQLPVAIMREDASGTRRAIQLTDLQAGDLVNVAVRLDVVLVTGTAWCPFTAVFFTFDEVVVTRSREELIQVWPTLLAGIEWSINVLADNGSLTRRPARLSGVQVL